jgi:2-iminoacetate synthase
MDLAKPGEIRNHCDPNAVSTFMEYLVDYAGEQTKEVGLLSIEKACRQMEDIPQKRALKFMELVKNGKRDVFC